MIPPYFKERKDFLLKFHLRLPFFLRVAVLRRLKYLCKKAQSQIAKIRLKCYNIIQIKDRKNRKHIL